MGTEASYRREMDDLLEKNADNEVAKTTRQGLRKMHAKMVETPRKADWRIQIVSRLWNYATNKQDWPLGPNPASNFDKYGTQKPFQEWPGWMVNELDSAPQNVRTLAYLIIGIGQRTDAAVGMEWAQFDGEWMTVLDEKQDKELRTYCPEKLRTYLGTLPRNGAHVIAKNLHAPVGYDAVEKEFRRWRKSLGGRAKPFTLHGLRKLAIMQLAEAGGTDAQIQAVTGQSAETVAYYRRLASREKLSRQVQEMRD